MVPGTASTAPLEYEGCVECGGRGVIKKTIYVNQGCYELRKCKKCHGKGIIYAKN